MRAALPKQLSDERLLTLGHQFDVAFERYLRRVTDANKVSMECEERLAVFNVPVGTARWQRIYDIACEPWLEAVREAGAAVADISRRIAAAPAETVAGLLVKAKTLPFDIIEQSDEELNAERLHAFIDQVELIAYGRPSC
jgi:hypothetical protein